MSLVTLIARQVAWSHETFGPGKRTKGLSDHIRKELAEIAENPESLEEWVDVILLALDGAWRCGDHTPYDIARSIVLKQHVNIHERTWTPPASEDDPAEHDRGERVANMTEVRKIGEREKPKMTVYEPGLG